MKLVSVLRSLGEAPFVLLTVVMVLGAVITPVWLYASELFTWGYWATAFTLMICTLAVVKGLHWLLTKPIRDHFRTSRG